MNSAILLAIAFAHPTPVDDLAILQAHDLIGLESPQPEQITELPDRLFQLDYATPEISVFQIEEAQPEMPEPFGSPDSSYWHIDLGLGNDFDERTMGRVGVGVAYFIAEDVSLDWDLALAYVDQPGDNAFAVNVGMLLRWHFLHDDEKKWTLYGEAGAGLLGATDDIPDNGTSFNFTPQLGFGATFDIGEGRQLFTGIRWFHISNANTFEDNPAVDFGMVHFTLAFPF